MKWIYKLSFVLALGFMVPACSDITELDLLDNPNAVTAENAGVDFLYNNIQLAFRNFYNNHHFLSTGIVRHTNMGSYTYVNALPPTAGNGSWYNAYANLFPDIDALLAITDASGLDVHAGTAKIMKAYVLTTLVDYYGNVPFSEAGLGSENLGPKNDDGASVYAAAEALLDEAIADLTGTNAARPANDNYYGGNVANWIKAANTLKLRIYVNTRLVDNSAASKIAAIVSSGNFIQSNAEDFQFNYGSQRNNPNSRHPFYNDSYETNDGTYQSNYLMWLMCCSNGTADPRVRYYFYRQEQDSNGQALEIYSCFLSNFPTDIETPDHYAAVDPDLPYCTASADGYYGRDHANGLGIPPDGPVRTVYGLYPGGGKWDGNTYAFQQKAGTTGGLGQGIAPIMLASFVDFLRAEVAIAGGDAAAGRTLLESGMRKSIAKVLSFKDRDPQSFAETITDRVTGTSVPRGDVFGVDAADVDGYVSLILDQYDAASDKMDVMSKQFMIATYGNSIEMYNFYRRTGKPNNMQPQIDVLATDNFPRSILYPADNVNLNINASQKTINDLVFWDPGTSSVR